MKLSEIVMAYRKEHGLSIRQFAQKCGLSHSAIANVENERNSMGNPYTPSFETLQHLALGMGLSVNAISTLGSGVRSNCLKSISTTSTFK